MRYFSALEALKRFDRLKSEEEPNRRADNDLQRIFDAHGHMKTPEEIAEAVAFSNLSAVEQIDERCDGAKVRSFLPSPSFYPVLYPVLLLPDPLCFKTIP